jgi:hypothetical protein
MSSKITEMVADLDTLLKNAGIKPVILPLRDWKHPVQKLDAEKLTAWRKTIPFDARHVDAALAGLCWAAGDWEQSHQVAQEIKEPLGSYWHYLLHRVEGDYWNANYWLQKAGRMSWWPEVVATVEPQRQSTIQRPEDWLKFCEQAANKSEGDDHHWALRLQDEEWRRLLRHCLND